MIYKIIKLILTSPIWALCAIAVLTSKNKHIILEDTARHGIDTGIGILSVIYNYLYTENAYRNVLYYRLSPEIASFLKFFFKENQCLHIATPNIGAGLLVIHGDSTYIYAKSVGKNLYINQCATIGAVGSGTPIIGDNVRVATGAIVIGDITIGNNVTIGAGAVVVKSIPDNCVVVGNPAKIIKQNGERVNISL